MSSIREGFQVKFDCGHKMIYDRASQHGIPEIGQYGRCHQCDTSWAGVDRVVIGLRQCWIETTTEIHFEKPNKDTE